MTTMTSKLPMNERPIILDPDLAAALETMLEPLNGKALERAQSAIRRIVASGIQVPFGQLVPTFRAAIAEAVGDRGRPDV